MFSKIFKNDKKSVAPVTVAVVDANQAAAREAAREAVKASWEDKLRQALGDDDALLALARQAPLADIRLAAVMALVSETALRDAERDFRARDRRVHRAIKQRCQALDSTRHARLNATALIDSATALCDEVLIPVNRLVELDHAWQALDASALEETQKSAYSAAWTRLTTLARERGDQQLSMHRWLADAKRSFDAVHSVRAELLRGAKEFAAQAQALADACSAAQQTLLAAPAAPAASSTSSTSSLRAATSPTQRSENAELAQLCLALQTAVQAQPPISARLGLLQQLPQHGGVSAEAMQAASQQWKDLPAVADADIARLLDTHFKDWQEQQGAARKARQNESRQRAGEQRQALAQVRSDALLLLVQAAEAALSEGQLGDAGKHLAALKDALGDKAAAGALQTRIEAVQAEHARLKGWQHWGGGRVRDDLVSEAETLAGRVTAAKLPLKQHAEDIDKLRARWKEVDRLGGATSSALWQRFDAALKAAYVPVAEHLQKLEAARQTNLQARTGLLDQLALLPLDAQAPHGAPLWRELAQALEHFQTQWRQLGPVEHTVPHKARAKLLTSMKAGVARLEAPLQAARSAAQAAREQLIERARQLAGQAHSRDLVARVRELQSEWQREVKSLPLGRRLDNALWQQFKAATDALFAQREAAANARDGEFKTHQAQRLALIARLREIPADAAAAADIRRHVSTIEQEWRQAGEVARSEAGKLESQFRAARETALSHIEGGKQRLWQAGCDALVQQLALCSELETLGSAAPVDAIEARWATRAALPKRWAQALDQRYQAAVAQAASGATARPEAAALDALLLQLEAGLDLPSPEAFQAARRELKLRALKNALETRQSATLTPSGIDQLVAAALAQAPAEAQQNQRLQAIIAALRAGGEKRLRSD